MFHAGILVGIRRKGCHVKHSGRDTKTCGLKIILFLVLLLLFARWPVRGNEEKTGNFFLEYEETYSERKIASRKFYFHVFPRQIPFSLFHSSSYKEEKSVCHTIELKEETMKKRVLVIWYRNGNQLKQAVFSDFPFSLTGILPVFMQEKKDESPLDPRNEIQGIAEIMVQTVPGKTQATLFVSYFNIECNGSFSLQTTSIPDPESSGKSILCGGSIGNFSTSDKATTKNKPSASVPNNNTE